MTTVETHTRPDLLSVAVASGYRTILIDTRPYGDIPDEVEVVSSMEHTVDVLVDLHTEPIVEPILVYVRNHEPFIGTPVQTLLAGLSMYSRRRGIVVAIDTSV